MHYRHNTSRANNAIKHTIAYVFSFVTATTTHHLGYKIERDAYKLRRIQTDFYVFPIIGITILCYIEGT